MRRKAGAPCIGQESSAKPLSGGFLGEVFHAVERTRIIPKAGVTRMGRDLVKGLDRSASGDRTRSAKLIAPLDHPFKDQPKETEFELTEIYALANSLMVRRISRE